MSGIKAGTKECDWTKAHLQKLFAAMKSSIPEENRMNAYTKSLKTLDWKKVAFHPFSPEACYEKWIEILNKMRKIRTLTELLDEAEEAVSNPVLNKKLCLESLKKPIAPHAIFFKENWAKFQENHPKMRTQKVFQLLNKNFKMLPDEEKALYVEKHQFAVEEYNRKKIHRKSYRKRKRADTEDQEYQDEEDLPPKPPNNGYNLFCKEQHASMAGDRRSSMCVWGERWRNLTESQKNEYNTRCRELHLQYSVKLKNYLMTLGKEEQKQILTKHGIKKPKGFLGEPKMPARSGTAFFCKVQMNLLKAEFPVQRERLRRVSQKWNGLSYEEKERYNEEAIKSLREYSIELQKWFKTLTPQQQEDYWTDNPKKRQFLDAKRKVHGRKSLKRPSTSKEQEDRQTPKPRKRKRDAGQPDVNNKKESLYRPSDSEDEDLGDSSNDEEEDNWGREEDEEEEEGEEEDVIMFEMY